MGRTLQDQISTLKGGLTSYFGLTGHQALDRLEGGSIRHDNPELLKYINEDSRRIELAPAFDDYNERLRIFKWDISASCSDAPFAPGPSVDQLLPHLCCGCCSLFCEPPQAKKQRLHLDHSHNLFTTLYQLSGSSVGRQMRCAT